MTTSIEQVRALAAAAQAKGIAVDALSGTEQDFIMAHFRPAHAAYLIALVAAGPQLVAGAAPASADNPSTAGAAEPLCPACQGSGEGVCMEGAGPDAYEVPCNCQDCGGSGGLLDAYHHLIGLLKAEREKYLNLCGRVSFGAAAEQARAAVRGAVLAVTKAIRDIRVDRFQSDEYKRGHSDARQTAAELALELASKVAMLAASPTVPAQPNEAADALLAALRKYGTHLHTCECVDGDEIDPGLEEYCDCGLNELLAGCTVPAQPVAAAADAGGLPNLPGCLTDRLYEAISIARDRAQHAGSTPRIKKWDATAADLRDALTAAQPVAKVGESADDAGGQGGAA